MDKQLDDFMNTLDTKEQIKAFGNIMNYIGKLEGQVSGLKGVIKSIDMYSEERLDEIVQMG